MLRAFISATGAIEGVKVDRSSGYAKLDATALRAAQGQKMLPASDNGVPVGACVTMPIVWKLD